MLLYHHPIDYKKGDKVKIVVGHKKGKMGTVVGDVFSGQGFTIQFDDGSVSDHHISTLAPEVYNKPISESVEINESRIDEMTFNWHAFKNYKIEPMIGDKVKVNRGSENQGRVGLIVGKYHDGQSYKLKFSDGETAFHHISTIDPYLKEEFEQIDERVAVIRKGEKGKEKYIVSSNGKETECKTHEEAYSRAAKFVRTQREQSLVKPKPAPAPEQKPAPAPEQKPVVKVASKKKKAAPTLKSSRSTELIHAVSRALGHLYKTVNR